MNPLPVLLLSLFVVAAVADDSITTAKIDGPGCGQRNPPYTEPMISPYIVNGEAAPPYVYPFICLLFHGTMQTCGGALITNSTGHYWFVTAAHCLLVGLDAYYIIRCGIYNTEGPSQPFEFRPRYLRPFVHEGYDNRSKNNDIALFPLYQDDFPKERVGAVCIPRQNKTVGESAIVLGWGNTRQTHGFQTAFSPTLKQGFLYIMSDAFCHRYYGGSTFMCAGRSPRGDDACQGDSGGPLVVDRDGELELLGLSSTGYGCGTFPGAYTDIMKLKPWLNSKINAWAPNPEVVG